MSKRIGLELEHSWKGGKQVLKLKMDPELYSRIRGLTQGEGTATCATLADGSTYRVPRQFRREVWAGTDLTEESFNYSLNNPVWSSGGSPQLGGFLTPAIATPEGAVFHVAEFQTVEQAKQFAQAWKSWVKAVSVSLFTEWTVQATVRLAFEASQEASAS